jgi:NAD(P)-dependent dehydrogenase (short-subunit alcohol dehydrogenase family)
MNLEGVTALVTGAARGFGAELARGLIERGAARVYTADLNPTTAAGSDQIIPLQMDITDEASIARAAAAAGDVDLLINNAGLATRSSVLTGSMDKLRLEMETNYFGTMGVTRYFAPILARNGGGTVLNVLSVQSWINSPLFGGYGAAKSAQWSLTNALRLELAENGTRVVGLHMGFMDTDMIKDLDVPKSSPAVIASLTLNGLEAELLEIVADEKSARIKALLSGDIRGMYPQLP